MAPDRHETRSVISLRTGSKVALLAALPFLGYALYNYVTPLWVPAANGVFGCGSARNPPTSGWAKGACQGVPDAALYRAMIGAGVGILLAVLGVVLFGVDRKEQTRPLRDGSRYDYEDDRYDDRHDDRHDDKSDEPDASDDFDEPDEPRRASGRRSYEASTRRAERRRQPSRRDLRDPRDLRDSRDVHDEYDADDEDGPEPR